MMKTSVTSGETAGSCFTISFPKWGFP